MEVSAMSVANLLHHLLIRMFYSSASKHNNFLDNCNNHIPSEVYFRKEKSP